MGLEEFTSGISPTTKTKGMYMIKILIVEDDEEIRNVLTEILRLEFIGVTVESVSSAREAKRFIDDRDIDLVISDMGLSDKYLGGSDVVKHAKEVRSAFTVIFSGAFSPAVSVMGGDIRSVDFILSKPFKREDLVNMFNVYRKYIQKAA